MINRPFLSLNFTIMVDESRKNNFTRFHWRTLVCPSHFFLFFCIYFFNLSPHFFSTSSGDNKSKSSAYSTAFFNLKLNIFQNASFMFSSSFPSSEWCKESNQQFSHFLVFSESFLWIQPHLKHVEYLLNLVMVYLKNSFNASLHPSALVTTSPFSSSLLISSRTFAFWLSFALSFQ